MQETLKKFRDRLRITTILYTFSEPVSNERSDIVGEFRTEIKIQAIDFLLRYPDFLSFEIMDLMENDNTIDQDEIQRIIKKIFADREPELKVEEMEKFFHGAYESIDDIILFLISTNFIRYESKKRRDGKEYEKIYSLTKYGHNKIITNLFTIDSVKWYFERCELIKKYFGKFSGTELKKRQYRYVEEYADVAYKSKIKRLHHKVKNAYLEKFKEELV